MSVTENSMAGEETGTAVSSSALSNNKSIYINTKSDIITLHKLIQKVI